MDDLNWQEVETIIDQALAIPEERRNEFVEKACGDDKRLKGEVTLLLESIVDSEGWLEEPGEYKREFYEEVSDDMELISADRSLVGVQVGSYTIKEKIGEGGMGSVYLAGRTDEMFEHHVAIKIVRHGKATEQNIRRFQREQRILAGLDHPGIARLFDGGITEDGFPYIIMEYVDGTPIDTYCEEQNCMPEEKINLFKQVLEAVRHAHENLVIHRDLKPGNILVNDAGNVKILDFGISKLLEEEPQDQPLTLTGSRLLTPRYAAPEQIRQQSITTATDMYALGIVFYQLLTGMHPFDLEGLSRYEAEQAILSKPAPKPSDRVSNVELKKSLRGDLDAIALKAIRKEPEERYRSANEFLEDLGDYLKGVPVTAREDSIKYRTKKFFKRHRQGAGVAAGVLLLLICMAAFYTWRITEERNQAQLEAQKAENISNFLMGMFEANYPSNARGEEITARQLLQEGRKNTGQITDETVKAEMLSVIGEAYSKLGYQDSSLKILKRSKTLVEDLYGDESLEYASASYDLGMAYDNVSDLALPHFKKAYEIRSERLGENDPQTARAMLKVGESYKNLNKFDSAKIYVERASEFFENTDAEDLQNAKNEMATLYTRLEEYDKAEQLYLDLIAIAENSSEPDSAKMSSWYQNLAWVYISQEEFGKAKPNLEKSLKITEVIYGKGHNKTLRTRNDLAGLNRDLGNIERFQELSETNIRHTIQRYGSDHRMACQANAAYGIQLTILDKFDKGEKHFRAALRSCVDALGEEHIWTAAQKTFLAANLEFNGKTEAARKYFQEGYGVLQKNVPNFNRINRRQVSMVLELYQLKDSTNKKKIEAYSELLDGDA